MKQGVMRFLLLFILGICVTFSANAQSLNQHKLDSLQRCVDARIGIDKFEPLVEIGIEYGRIQDDLAAMRVLEEANRLAFQFGDTANIIRSSRMVGQLYYRLSKPIEAENILLKILPVAQRASDDQGNLFRIFNLLGLTYTVQGLYDKALNYHFKSLAIVEANGDKNDISISLNNIGLVYYMLNNYDKAIDYYVRSLTLKRDIEATDDLDRLLINMSLCYTSKKQFKAARKYLDDAFSLCKSNCLPKIIIEGEFARGDIYYQEGHYLDAERSFLKSYNLSNQIENKRFQLENLVKLIEMSLKQLDYKKAEEYLKTAETISKDSKFNYLQMQVWHLYAEYYNHFNDYKKSTSYQSKYIQLRDSLYSEELTQNLMVVQTEYEQQENKAKIEAQDKELSLKEAVINRQRILTFVAGAAIVLLAMLIFALYRNNQQKKLASVMLEQKVKERTNELETSYQQIQKAYSEQNHFVVRAANEIKSPLSTVKGLCMLGLKEIPDEETQQYINQINDAANQLSEMVSKLENSKD